MRRIHLPVWLDGASKPRAGTFVILFSLEAWSRATLITLVPLQAHQLFGDAQSVSVLYFSISIAGLIAAMVIPILVHWIRRRWAFSVGAVLMLVAVGAYSTGIPAWFAFGLACQVVATAFLEIVMNLYVLDHVPRSEITKFEPKRLLFVAAPFTFGPWLGVWLAEHMGPLVAYITVGFFVVMMACFFWFLRITDNPAVSSPLKRPPNPIKYLPKFFKQPRLRLAWGLAIGRTGWWILFFVYAPIYLTTNGYSNETAGLIISLGVGSMFLASLWGRLGQKYGIRFLLTLGYGLTGIVTILIAVFHGTPTIAVGLIVASAFVAVIIDGAGNVPFLRAVHALERSEMTSVYVTFRHTSQLVTPGIFAIALGMFALPAVFAVGGVACFGMAALARYLPKKL